MAAATTSVLGQIAAAAASQEEHTTEDGTSFEGLVGLYYAFIFRLLLRYTKGDEASSEDITQETFIRAYQAFPGFSGNNDGVRPWLARIAYNQFLDYCRARRSRDRFLISMPCEPESDSITEIELPDQSSSAFETMVSQDQSRLVDRMLHFLNPSQRAVIILCELRGHSKTEASLMLGVPIGTIKSRWHRGHEKLNELAQRLRDSDDPMLKLL